MSYSRAVVNVQPNEVKAQTKAGRRVGTRRPTGKGRTESGTDGQSLINLSTVRERNPQLYRRMALQLLELDIVAARHPELAKFVAKEQAKASKIEVEIGDVKDKIGRYNSALKKLIAKDRGLLDRKGQPQTSKVKADLLAEYEEAPEAAFVKDSDGNVIRTAAMRDFKARLALRNVQETKLEGLQEKLTKARAAYGTTLTSVAANG